MTSITPNLAASAIGRADAHDPAAATAADAGPFVLNLCSSTTPMALAHPDLAELKRFTFFVSRRFEEGRERFRLHMGYFTTQAEAEEWLAVVREIYPGAWAGEAPGKKLRARAAAAAAAQAQHAIGPVPPSPPAAAKNPTPAPRAPAPAPALAPARPIQQAAPAAVPVARPVEPHPTASRGFDSPGMTVPTVHAAAPPPGLTPPVLTPPVAKAAPVQALAPPSPKTPPVPAAVPVAKAAPVAVPAPATVRAPVAATAQSRLAPVAGIPTVTAAKAAPAAPVASMASRAPAAAVPPRLAAAAKASAPSSKGRPGAKPPKGNAFDDSNVREVLASLDDTGETGQTRMMPVMGQPSPQLARVDASDDGSLSDTQVLRYLETRREDGGRAPDDSPDASISLLKPDDTGTRRALKEAVTQNAAVSFAVQLQWAVQPVELDKVPPLAIFSAYTLYTVEGSREGRKWYGLRLGFFSDAISAKQVAYYVRSEFASVAVVPVSPQEKIRATEEDSKKANSALPFPRKTRQGPVDEFKLIDSDDVPHSTMAAPSKAAAVAKPAAVGSKPVAKPGAAPAPAPTAAKQRTIAKGGARVGARERRGPQTLEETLEILGAGELEVDHGNSQSLNEAGVRHLRVEVQKNTPFSRLLERLSERTKKN